MAHSPQDIYARHLVSRRGYPLWTPEPNMNLPDVYLREGLKIGDVGVVVPEDGSFDVFFNVCLPPTHSLHRETGVPNKFTPIPLSRRDIARFPEAEGAGRIISTSSVARVRNTDVSDEGPASHAQPGPLNYEFTLSSREGAVLILPEGAERYYLRNERLFLDAAIRHAVDWYTFAEQRLGRIISHDSLYLITGFYKARSWSLAAYQQGAGTGESSAQFKAVQVGRGNIAASYTWETTHAMDWRVGPSDQYYNGIPNQTVFIQGFKIAVREGILGTKWVNVKADFPSVRPYCVEFSGSSWFSNLWNGASGSSSGSTADTLQGTDTAGILNMDTTENNLLVGGSDNVRITIDRVPQVTKPFHPSDIINQHLLREVPSAIVAVTHDAQWTTLLERGLLDPGELSQEDRLVACVTSNYSMVSAHEGAVYLQNTTIENDNDDDAITASEFSAGHPELSSIPPDTPTTQLSDSNLPVTGDPSAKPYACAYGSIPFTNPESCHAMYRTAHELREHVTVVHLDIVGTHMLAFRCGLAGCGQSWKSIGELEHHVEFSGAHSQNTNPEGSTGLFAESSESRQVLPAIPPARYADSGTSALEEPHDEPIDKDWVGGVGIVGEETRLHTQCSLPTDSRKGPPFQSIRFSPHTLHLSAFRGQTSRQYGGLIPRAMNNLYTIADQDDYDEDLLRGMRDFNNEDKHDKSTSEQVPHQKVIKQSSTANLSSLLPHLATAQVPSPPPASHGDQSLTYDIKRQPFSGLRHAGTLQQTGSRYVRPSMSSNIILRSSKESSGDLPPFSTVHQEAEPIEIDSRECIFTLAYLADGRWVPIDAGDTVPNTAASRDGKWVVESEVESGRVMVWDVESHKVMEFKGHGSRTHVVDVSPDGVRIATGSEDKAACVWSLSTGQRLLSPLQHDYWVVTVKFSPDGCRIATAWRLDSLIYDSQNGCLLVNFPVKVNSLVNQSLAWTSNSDELFALSCYGNVNCLDVSTRITSRWPIHSSRDPACIALASNGTFIAASGDSSISFWDTITHKQIGPVIEHTNNIKSMVSSPNYDLTTAGGKTITFRSLCDILPSPYFDTFLTREWKILHMGVAKAGIKEALEALHAQDGRSKIVPFEEKDSDDGNHRVPSSELTMLE